MRGRVWIWIGLGLGSGCGFHPPFNPAGDGPLSIDVAPHDGTIADAPPDARPDAPPDAIPCLGEGLLHVCFPTVPPAMLTISTGTLLDTDNDPRCTPVPQGNGPTVCMLAAQTVSITAPLAAVGSRPLAVVALGTLSISGPIDVSSHRSPLELGAGHDDAACTAQSPVPDDDLSGGGGGAGGSYAAVGGNGGIGDTNFGTPGDGTGAAGVAGGAQQPTVVRGGCAGGQGGNGFTPTSAGPAGHGGGALYLLAGTQLAISASLAANGAGGEGGGNDGGGGGGGTGGLIGLEAPSIMVSSLVTANGGGGGEGGDHAVPAGHDGNPGSDGAASTTQAATGGSGPPSLGGVGGTGGVAAIGAVVGANSGAAGGGGGGSVGVIYVHGTLAGSGQFSPAPQF